MLIQRSSLATGVFHERDLPVTQEQLDAYYIGGALLQCAFPDLSADDREFIKTGITKEEWEEIFGKEE